MKILTWHRKSLDLEIWQGEKNLIVHLYNIREKLDYTFVIEELSEDLKKELVKLLSPIAVVIGERKEN